MTYVGYYLFSFLLLEVFLLLGLVLACFILNFKSPCVVFNLKTSTLGNVLGSTENQIKKCWNGWQLHLIALLRTFYKDNANKQKEAVFLKRSLGDVNDFFLLNLFSYALQFPLWLSLPLTNSSRKTRLTLPLAMETDILGTAFL